MITTPQSLPDYENPPLIEVVCGVIFTPIENILAPHFGLLWEKFKSDYPTCQEAPPLASVIESFDKLSPMSIPVGDLLQFSEILPLPRIGFVHTTGSRVIQVQRDRFLHNWRRLRAGDEYPRYGNVIRMFREHLLYFDLFVKETELGTIVPLQYEMTYLNHIPLGHGWTRPGDIGKLFPDFAWRLKAQRFLPEFENNTWQTTFVLPNQAGRLYVTIRQAMRPDDQQPILMFDLTIRGMGNNNSSEVMWQ